MVKRQRRSPAEIQAALEARLAKVSQRAAIDESKSNPVLRPLFEAREALNREIAVQSRGFSTGPQSFEERRTSHSLWLNEINAAEKFANAAISDAKNHRETLDAKIKTLSDRVQAGEAIDPQEVKDAVTFQSSTEYEDAKSEFANAQGLRKAYKTQVSEPAPTMPMVAEANFGD